MRRVILHFIAYLLVGATCFTGGIYFREFLGDREGAKRRAQILRFIGKEAPAINTTTLDGAHWSMDAVEGKVVVLEFWSSFCGPCITQIPEYRDLQSAFGEHPDFALIGVSLDEDEEDARAVCTEHGMTWPQLFEPGRDFDTSVAKAFGVDGIPFVCVIDKSGVVRAYGSAVLKGDPHGTKPLVAKLLAE